MFKCVIRNSVNKHNICYNKHFCFYINNNKNNNILFLLLCWVSIELLIYSWYLFRLNIFKKQTKWLFHLFCLCCVYLICAWVYFGGGRSFLVVGGPMGWNHGVPLTSLITCNVSHSIQGHAKQSHSGSKVLCVPDIMCTHNTFSWEQEAFSCTHNIFSSRRESFLCAPESFLGARESFLGARDSSWCAHVCPWPLVRAPQKQEKPQKEQQIKKWTWPKTPRANLRLTQAQMKT